MVNITQRAGRLEGREFIMPISVPPQLLTLPCLKAADSSQRPLIHREAMSGIGGPATLGCYRPARSDEFAAFCALNQRPSSSVLRQDPFLAEMLLIVLSPAQATRTLNQRP
jgi:hypothetical protein